jgi:microcystin-dependent protein
MSFPVWNSDPSFNKITSTYFKDLIDLSGNLIIRNGTIRSPANTIVFDDSATNSINFTNVKITGNQKLIFNSVVYDIGEVAFKSTNISFNQSTNTTSFSGVLSYPVNSIASSSISNSSFVSLTGNQGVGGQKTFNSQLIMNNNFRMDTGSFFLGTGGTVVVTNAQIQLIPSISILNSKTTNQTYSSLTNQTQFSNLLEFTGTLNGFSVSNFNNAITQTLSLSSPAQSQLNTLTSNLSTTNTIITGITYTSGTSTTNIPKIIFTTSLNNISAVTFSYLANVQGDIAFSISNLQSQINNIPQFDFSANNVFTGQCKFTNTLQLDSSLLIKTPSASVTLSNDNLTRIQYLSNVSSDLNTSITNLNTKTTDISYSGTTTSVANTLATSTLTFSSTLNNISTTTFAFLSNATENLQGAINSLKTKTTDISYSGTTTSVANTLASATLTFSGTLNNISTTTFAFLSNATENLQGAINSLKTKTDTTNVNVATLTTTVNDFALRTTEMSYSDDPTPQTVITNKIVLEEVVFTTDLNDITPTTFGYLANCSSNIQNQLNSKADAIAGTIIQHISANLQTNFPTRFLLCNGQSVSRTTYANLFSYIGTTYGSVDGNSFNVPDFTACVLRMYSSPRTVNGVVYTPNTVGTIQQDSLEAHVHSSNLTGSYLINNTVLGVNHTVGTTRYNTSSFPAFTGAVSSSHRTSTETRPLNHSVYFYITC